MLTAFFVIAALAIGYLIGDSMSRVHTHIPDVNEPCRHRSRKAQ